MAHQNLMTSNSRLAAVALTSTLFGLISIGEAGRRTVRDLRQRSATEDTRPGGLTAPRTRHSGGVDSLAA